MGPPIVSVELKKLDFQFYLTFKIYFIKVLNNLDTPGVQNYVMI